ncbi:MAG: DUF4251 domain-containing protein [Bacteroidetes bacterium]|nr:DUF4251 domain-containing protein [Bacteroidota bacterium]
MNIRILGLAIILAVNSFAAMAQNSDVAKKEAIAVKEIVESRNFKINILNVLREKRVYMDIYSKNTIEIADGKLIAKFPYFYRNDNPSNTAQAYLKIDSDIRTMKIKNKAKRGMYDVSIKIEKPSKYVVNIDIGYDGNCMIYVTNSQKTTVVYGGRLIEPNM